MTECGPVEVRALAAADAPRYRELMLQAYAQDPDAYTSTAQERADEPLSWWERRIGAPGGLTECFGAFAGSRLVGTVALEYSSKPKTQHAVLLLGMYVLPAQRGQGTGAALMRAALAAAWARPQTQALGLTLTEGNDVAQRLYERHGFVAWGTEPCAILTTSGMRGKVHMALTTAPGR